MLIRIFLLISIAASAFASEPQEPPTLAAYGRLPAVEDMTLSPSGNLLATVVTIGERRVLLIGRTGKEVLHRFNVSELKLRGLYWAGDKHLIVQVSSTQNLGFLYGGKHELFNLMTINIETGESDWPLANSKKVLNAAFAYHQPVYTKGSWYQCVNTMPTNFSPHSGAVWISNFEFDLSCINLDSGKRRTLVGGRRDGERWVISPNMDVLALDTYDDVKGHWRLQNYKKRRTLVEAKDLYNDNTLLGQGRSAGTVIYYQNDEQGVSHLMEVALSGETAPVELFAEFNIRSPVFDNQTGLFAGLIQEGDVPELEMFDDRKQAIIVGTRKAFPNSNVHFRSASMDWQKLLVYTDGAADSGTWWLVDIAAGDAKPMAYSYPEVRASQVGTPSIWKYSASDGLVIPAILTTPTNRELINLPLIVLPHGGPESRDYLGFDWLAQAFASRGYVVLQPNFRGSGHYSVSFRNAGFGEWGRKMQTDLSDGVNALAKEGMIDPQRVCIVGASYGGYAALAGVTLQQDVYRCAVSIAGLSDLPVWLRSFESKRLRDGERYIDRFIGVNNSRADELEALSPAYLAARADAPVLLIHGKDDTRVPIHHSKKMFSKLKSNKKPVEFIALEGEDHFLSRSETRQQTLEAAIGFVQKYNPAK